MSSKIDINKSNHGFFSALHESKRRKYAGEGRYDYTSIDNLVVGANVNLYAVAKNISGPRPTRGSDYIMSLSVIDASKEDSFNINLFGPEDLFPKVRKGDIIRFHRLKIQDYKGEIQGYGKLGTRGLSILVFDSNEESSFEPLGSSSKGFTWEGERDKDILSSLRIWLKTFKNLILVDSDNYRITIEQLRQPNKDYFDLICKVIKVKPTARLDETVLLVWDGTYLANIISGAEYDKERTELLCSSTHDLLPKRANELSSIIVAKGFSHCGIRMRNTIEAGMWVKLRNFQCRLLGGGDIGIYGDENSSFCELNTNDPEVESLLENFDRRVFELEAREQGHSATYIPHRTAAVSTIQQVLQYKTPCMKFRIQARLEDYHPRTLEHFTQQREDGSWVYLIKLTLCDSTGTLDALLYDKDGEEFFDNTPATDLTLSSVAYNVVQNKLNMLLTHDQLTDFCIMSYVKRGDRKYRLFNTRVL